MNGSNDFWEGKKIKLCALEESDWEQFKKIRQHPDSEMQLFTDLIELPKSEREIKEEFERKLKHDGDSRLFTVISSSNEYVGEIDIWDAKIRMGIIRYGIFINAEHRHKGYATEALSILFDYYFNELNYRKAAPHIYAFNKSSLLFHQNFGFIKEGELREHWYARGKYHNVFFLGMMKNEFNKLYNKRFDIKSQ